MSILVLIIGLANAATLLLVRGTRQKREAAIRTALGATRGRLFAQVLAEAAILAVISTAGALALASWLGEVVRRVLLAGVIEHEVFTLRTIVVAVAAGLGALALAASVGVAQMPRHVRAGDLSGASYGARRSRAYPVLLLVQTTLSVVLMAGAGLFGRSLYNLRAQDFGMRLSDVVLVGFEPGPNPVAGQAELFRAALERIRQMPGVDGATEIQTMPFAGHHVPPIGVPGMAEPPSVNGQLPFLIAATPEFLRILGIDIVQGRAFTGDDERGAPVVIVNQTMARTVWPGESALGKCIRIGFDPSFDPFTATGPPGPPTSVPCREVVGVSRDVRQRSVVPGGGEDRLMQYFVPLSQVPGPPAALVRRQEFKDCWFAPGRCRGSDRPNPSRGAEWTRRSAVCRGPALPRSAGAADAPMESWHGAADAVRRARAERVRHWTLRGLRPRDRRAPARDGDPDRDWRSAGSSGSNDLRERAVCRRGRGLRLGARRRGRPLAAVDARRHGSI